MVRLRAQLRRSASLAIAFASLPLSPVFHRSAAPSAEERSPHGRLSPTGAMSTPRAGHTATLLRNGLVLIAGGMRRNRDFYRSAELYDPATGRFRATGDMTSPRVGHTATLLPDGRVLVAGGWDGSGATASAELYDPGSETFVPTGPMGTPRGSATATLLEDGKVLIAGGEDRQALALAERYDPVTGTFAPTGPMRAARTSHTATPLPDGRVLITGGGEYRHPLSSAEVYNPRTGGFSPAGAMTEARYKHAAVPLPDGTVLVLGGSDGQDWNGRKSSTEIYDPARGSFTDATPMRVERFKFGDAVAPLGGGRVLLAGGGTPPEVYDARARTSTALAPTGDGARYFATATRLTDGRVLIAGGYDRSIAVTEGAWIYEE